MNPLNRQWFYKGFRKRLAVSLGRDVADEIWDDAGKEYSKGFRHIRYDRNSAVSEGARACEYRLRFDMKKA